MGGNTSGGQDTGQSSSNGIYFGWFIVAATTILTLLTIGMRLGIGPFFLPMTNDLGLTRSQLSSVIAVGMMVYGLAMPLAGYLVSAWGTRKVLLAGAVLVLIAVGWTVVARSELSLMLSFGALLSVGLAFTSPVSVTPVISRWFVRQRGMALFCLSAGSMAGIAILTPVFTWGIQTFGWRETLLGFAVLFAIASVPTALFVIREDAPEHADTLAGALVQANKPGVRPIVNNAPSLKLREAIRTTPFWQLTFGLFACGFSMNLLGTHGMPMLMDHGFDAGTSSFGIALIGIVAIFSSLALGRLSDIVERRNILMAIYIVRGLGFFALVEVMSPWQLYTVAAIGGIVWAGSVAISSAIMADVYGVRLVGVLYGWAYVGHQIGGTLSSWLGGWAYDTFHTHLISFGAAGTLLLAAAATASQLPLRGMTLMGRAPAAG
ncbi:MFS transporter [Allopusillimonas soli]|uniref:MFS transporter n=1 Tax=Allopusillimonas soli TaxID=659016 RepID=A0A853FDQ0_9BURK|nr:MFS transporter [Allopusillimonas soli]NYT38985.1 MFS transporter [Allopusillimonas soli]TEA69572.1 MFS transporter [Allopusillimonas soli]